MRPLGVANLPLRRHLPSKKLRHRNMKRARLPIKSKAKTVGSYAQINWCYFGHDILTRRAGGFPVHCFNSPLSTCENRRSRVVPYVSVLCHVDCGDFFSIHPEGFQAISPVSRSATGVYHAADGDAGPAGIAARATVTPAGSTTVFCCSCSGGVAALKDRLTSFITSL